MTVQVPEQEIQAKIAKRLQSLARQVKVDGFRPGKVPHSVIKKRYGPQVREEVLSDLIQSSFYDAVRDGQLKPAGAPEIIARKADEGEGLEYEAKFEVMPEFVPMPLEVLEVKRFVSEVTDADVDAMLHRLREQRLTWREADHPAVNGDRVIISFEGFDGEESFTNGKVDGFPVVLGSGSMIPGFEDKLVGTEPGTELNFELDFPEDYPGAKMAGKRGRFAITVTGVEESVLPELDAEFAKYFDVEDGDLEGLRRDIRGNMERELKRVVLNRTKLSVMDQLYARNAISLPQALVNDELNDLLKPYRESAEQRKQSLDEAKLREQLDPVARRRVALALVLGKLIDAYHLTVDPARVRKTVDDLSQSYEDPEEVVRWYYAEKGRLREVEGVVLEDQIVDLILEKANVTEERLDFQGLMQAGQAAAT
jgi:trigger factor